MGLLPMLLLAAVLSACSTHPVTRDENRVVPAMARGDENNPGIDRHGMLQIIMGLMSTPYELQGVDSSGIDCSGFTQKIYADAVHTSLPHSSRQQYELGYEVANREVKFGDLVFFQLEEPGPSHVGIYIGDGLFAHASVSRGVTISLFESSFYQERYLGARRIVY